MTSILTRDPRNDAFATILDCRGRRLGANPGCVRVGAAPREASELTRSSPAAAKRWHAVRSSRGGLRGGPS